MQPRRRSAQVVRLSGWQGDKSNVSAEPHNCPGATMNHQLIRRTTDRLRSTAVRSRFSLTADAPESNSAIAVKVLNQALRIAQFTVLRSKRQYRMALRHHAPALAAAALEHANDARLQSDRIAERIVGARRPPGSLPRLVTTAIEPSPRTPTRCRQSSPSTCRPREAQSKAMPNSDLPGALRPGDEDIDGRGCGGRGGARK